MLSTGDSWHLFNLGNEVNKSALNKPYLKLLHPSPESVQCSIIRGLSVDVLCLLYIVIFLCGLQTCPNSVLQILSSCHF